jgi:hypothetical protein
MTDKLQSKQAEHAREVWTVKSKQAFQADRETSNTERPATWSTVIRRTRPGAAEECCSRKDYWKNTREA